MRWVGLARGILVAGSVGLGQLIHENISDISGSVEWPVFLETQCSACTVVELDYFAPLCRYVWICWCESEWEQCCARYAHWCDTWPGHPCSCYTGGCWDYVGPTICKRQPCETPARKEGAW